MNTIIHQPYLFARLYQDVKPSCLVFLSSYNGERYIEEQLLSILHQDNVDVHILVRDDGSSDNTLGILNKLKLLYPSQLEVLSGSNVGLSKSFATLFQYAPSCDYFAFADQDDVWDRDKLFVGIGSLMYYHADFYSSASRLVDQDLNPIGRTTSNPKLYSFYMNGTSKIFTPGSQGCTIIISQRFFSLLKNNDYPTCYGHDTWITCVGLLLFDSVYDSDPHMSYRQHNLSWTGNRKSRFKHFFKQTKFFLSGLHRYHLIAKDILLRFSNSLNETDKAVLLCIAEKKTSFAGRFKDISTYRFGKYGFLRNLIYRLYYLFSN